MPLPLLHEGQGQAERQAWPAPDLAFAYSLLALDSPERACIPKHT